MYKENMVRVQADEIWQRSTQDINAIVFLLFIIEDYPWCTRVALLLSVKNVA